MKALLSIAVCLAMISSASVCLAQTELVNDNFDSGTNGAYLGPNWTGCGFFLGAYNKLVYQNSQAGGGGYYSQNCAVYTGYGVFPADQYATATVVAPNPMSTTQAGIQLRQNAVPSTPESYIACGWNAQDFPADYHYRIWSMAPNPPAGGPSSLYLSSVTPATDDVVWCQVLGNTVTMKVNGNIIASLTDTSGILSGYPGLYYVDPNGGAPPSTDVIWDNFAAGAGPALVSLTITPSSTTATEGSFVQFTGTATYADGTTENLSSWSSSDTSVATVDSSGFVYAANQGNVTITGSTGVDSRTATLTVNAAQGYTPLVDDPFTGQTGAYLSSTNWTGCGYYGGSYSPLMYRNNQAGGGGYSSQECAVYTGFGPFPNDQYATATIVSPNPTSSPQAGVQLRQNATPSTPEYYIACGWNAQDFPADYHYRIWSMQPDPPTGGPTSLYLSNVTPASNDVVWCQVTGTTVTMQVNGSTIATVTDNSGVTSGYPGLYYIDPNPDVPPPNDVIWDNFVAGRIDSQQAATVTFTGAPASAVYNTGFTVTATSNASTMPKITGTANVCTVGAVGGTPAKATAGVIMTSGTGTCTLTATWAADPNYPAPSPRTQSTIAARATSTVTINSRTPNPSTLQQAVTVRFSAAGTGVGPTGSVTVSASGGESCSATLTSAHSGSCSITFLSAGSRTLSAGYAGDNNLAGSTSASVTQTVNSPSVGLSPSSLNFGNVTLGNSVTLGETITNTGTGALIPLSWNIHSNNSSQFKVSSTTCGSTLNPGSSCVIRITFKPNSRGPQSGALNLTDNATNSPQSLPLSGTGQ